MQVSLFTTKRECEQKNTLEAQAKGDKMCVNNGEEKGKC